MELINFLLRFSIQPDCKGKHVQTLHFCQCEEIINFTSKNAKSHLSFPLHQAISLICHLSGTHWPFCETAFNLSPLRAQTPNFTLRKTTNHTVLI